MTSIISVEHRHGEQPKGAPDLLLAVGKPVPAHYGRRPGTIVIAIEDGEPLQCMLNDGGVILVGQHAVTKIARAE